jgi:hypothetical protein
LIRLTRDNIKKILYINEGFTQTANYKSRSFTENKRFVIKDGKLLIYTSSKICWDKNVQNNIKVADLEQTRKFINKNLHLLELGSLLRNRSRDN